MLNNYVRKSFGAAAIAIVIISGLIIGVLIHFDKVDVLMAILHGILG